MASVAAGAAEPRYFRDPADVPSELETPTGTVADTRGRPLRDLRISVTDRCNFRCVYCMPKEIYGSDYEFMPRTSLLTFEEIFRLARIAVSHGVEKLRLTGGEPLLRKNIEELIALLSGLRTPDGRRLDIALTTNGSALAAKAHALKEAGLERVTVSLDSLDDSTFRAMNDVDFPVARVLRAIDAASEAGLGPIKINMVVKAGVNEKDIVPMARRFRGTPHILRFIEYMDVGNTNGWRMTDVVSSAEVVRRVGDEFPLEEVAPNYEGETSERWRYRDGAGEIGAISSVTRAFCHSCTRARISTEGKLYTCLFATHGHDLRALLRAGCSDEQLATVMAHIWRARADRYSELRGAATEGLPVLDGKKIEMSYIGG